MTQKEDKKERILTVAESLFAGHGFSGTSMRKITQEAGVNVAAVNYYFGTKEDLYREVFRRRLGLLNQARIVKLDLLEQEAGGSPISPRNLLEAFFSPAEDMARDATGGGAAFMKMLMRACGQPELDISDFVLQEYQPVMARYMIAARRALPELPVEEISWRLHFVAGAAIHAFAGDNPLGILATGLSREPHAMKQKMIDFFVGGISGTVSTADQAAGSIKNRY